MGRRFSETRFGMTLGTTSTNSGRSYVSTSTKLVECHILLDEHRKDLGSMDKTKRPQGIGVGTLMIPVQVRMRLYTQRKRDTPTGLLTSKVALI
jgi:hypothetical protein